MVHHVGGLGAGKGWLQLRFIPSVDLLRKVFALEGVRLIVTNRGVPLDYLVTDPEAYLSAWALMIEQVGSGQPMPKNEPPILSVGLIDKDVRVDFQTINHRVRNGPDVEFQQTGFKLVELGEPAVNLAPAEIWTNGVRLSAATSGLNCGLFALHLSFPKVIFTKETGFAEPFYTDEYLNRAVYDRVRSLVMAECRPMTFELGGRKNRTPIRISPELLPIWGNHAYLEMNGVKVHQPERA